MDSTGPISTDLVLDTLERITTSPALRRSPQLVAFLSYIVREELAGRGSHLKSYTIATDALGRPSSFDPARDPIVRVEARRLRSELDAYYSNSGSADPVRITVPTGSYRPQFAMQVDHLEALDGQQSSETAVPVPSQSVTPPLSLPFGAARWLPLAFGLAWLINLALLIAMLIILQQQRAEMHDLFRRYAAEKTISSRP